MRNLLLCFISNGKRILRKNVKVMEKQHYLKQNLLLNPPENLIHIHGNSAVAELGKVLK